LNNLRIAKFNSEKGAPRKAALLLSYTQVHSGGQPAGEGGSRAAPEDKKPRQRFAAADPFFPRKKQPASRTCRDRQSIVSAVILTCASSKFPRPSQVHEPNDRLSPWVTAVNFIIGYLGGTLLAYSGGTVRDFHPVPYSPREPERTSGALKRLFTF